MLAHRQEFLAALSSQCAPRGPEKWAQSLVDRLSEAVDGLLRQPMRSPQRLGYDAIDNPQTQEILSGQPQRFRRLLGMLPIAPQNRGAAFGGDHRIDRVLQH